MATAKSSDLILNIINAGGSVIVDADKSTDLLIKLATAAAKSGAKVTIMNSGKKSTDLLVQIARAGAGNVTFDLTK